MRQDAIERRAILLVGVEAEIDEVTQESAALRSTKSVSVLHLRGRCRIMLQPCHRIANRSVAESGDGRSFREIKHLVGLSGFKTAFEANAAAFEVPELSRHFLALRVSGAISHDETAFSACDVHGWIIGQIGDRLLIELFVRREDRAHHTANRAAVLVFRPWHFQAQLISRHIKLPADIHQREACFHHPLTQTGLPTAIRNLHPCRPIAARVVFRLPQPQIGHKAHFARRIHRSQIHIRDDRIPRQLRINLEV